MQIPVKRAPAPRGRSAMIVVGVLGIVAFACMSGAAPPVTFAGAPGDATAERRAPLGSTAPRVRPALDATLVRPSPRAVTNAPRLHEHRVVTGEATYYADRFEGRTTASGLPFHQHEMYAAHRTFPFGTVLRVTNERNGRSVVVRVVDRGPWGAIAKRRHTIIDLSRSAAEQLGYIRAGRTAVRIEVLLVGAGV